jgi:hypothetical protein
VPAHARTALAKPGVKIVIVDDDAIEETMRGRLLNQVQRWVPQALVAYIAAIHNPAIELRARTHHVQYYISRPVDRERTMRVLRCFANSAR